MELHIENLPLYLRTPPEQFFIEIMEERREFSRFMRDEVEFIFERLVQSINSFIEQKFQNQAVAWIGGSRSWNKALNCEYNVPKSKFEENSILPGNYDVFILSPNEQIHKVIICELGRLIDIELETLSNYMGEFYKFKTILGNIKYKSNECSIKFPTSKESCTLFPCQSMMINIKSKKIPKDYKGPQTSSPFSEDRSVLSQREALSDDFDYESNYPIIKKDKLLFYFESFVIPDINIKVFKDNLLTDFCKNTNSKLSNMYLNPVGLLLLSEFITTPRTHKGLNIDNFRKELLFKSLAYVNNTIPMSQIKYEAYKHILIIYDHIFKDSKYKNKFLIKEIIKKLILATQIDVYTDIEEALVNTIRPYVNSFLKNINFKLMSVYGDKAFLMLVGGDAMRRYDINISKTSDFDTKLYIREQSTKRRGRGKEQIKDDIHSLLIEEMSIFTTFLSSNHINILPSGQKIYNIVESDNFIVTSRILTPFNQFRLRYIKKSEDFPIDLYSIDFRTTINAQFQNANVELHVDIPFLDIVIIQDKNASIDQLISKSKSQIIPIASLNFLLKDLNNIYETPHLAAARYWNDKVTKDKYRFRILTEIKENNFGQKTASDLDVLIETDFMNSVENVKLGKEYSTIFNELINKSTSNKIKMGFEKLIDDDLF